MEEKWFTFIESPFKGRDWQETKRNLSYVKACARDCLLRGEVPYASHMFFTQRGVLDDRVEEDRMMGITSGKSIEEALTLASQCVEGIYACTVVYADEGISEGMKFGIRAAKQQGREVFYRMLGPDWEARFKEFIASKEWLDLGFF